MVSTMKADRLPCPKCGFKLSVDSIMRRLPCPGCSYIHGQKEREALMKDTTAKSVCDDAAKIVSSRNGKDKYGPIGTSLKSFSKLLSAYLGCEISREQAGMIMVLLKVSRTTQGSFLEDNYIDIAGWAGIAGEMASTDRYRDKKE